MSVTESNKCVFLLGAGFSTAWGPPVMRTFMTVARRRYFEEQKRGDNPILVDAYRVMLDFHSECLASNWAVNRDWNNIEELYTQADLLRLCNVPGAKRKCKQIALAIWDVYRSVDGHQRSGTGRGGIHPLECVFPPLNHLVFKILQDKLMPVFITTNYDSLIESSLLCQGVKYLDETQRERQRCHKFFYPGFTMPAEPSHCGTWTGKLIPDHDKHVPVVKLHGSVTWFHVNGRTSECISTGMFYDPAPHAHVFNSKEFKFNQFMTAAKSCGGIAKKGGEVKSYEPAIIPPMLGKSSVAPMIPLQWKTAIDAFKKARMIIVIGYSFPPTDLFMKRLLAEGLRENRDLDFLMIVDRTRPEEWIGRVKEMFASSQKKGRGSSEFDP